MSDAPGTLYIVSTPIGNLGDLSARAIETLRNVAVVLAEDTRHSRPLLQRFEIDTPLLSYHEHNEARTADALVARLIAGESMALISDAGTPLLSDPGARLVAAAIEASVRVVPIPGASALLSALVASGISGESLHVLRISRAEGRGAHERARGDCVAFTYGGAVRGGAEGGGNAARSRRRSAAARAWESVARELTKQFEEVRRGTLDALALYYEESPPRGEVVLVIAGAPPVIVDENAAREKARALRAGGLSARDVARALVAEQGITRNAAYKLAQEED